MPNNTNGGGNGAVTALLAILVIAVIAFGIWYVMKTPAPEETSGPGIQVNLGTQNPEQQ
ncbi:MAG: hypothetical protein Athens041674_374 [Parcubacteria group bacterium Athens0416_74]|nr:MAG: hypothetical protein Athens041674_374 [Parcubacteria group bacterium Athens0416_74]